MKKNILLCAIYFLGCAAYAQTTIGSDNEPVKGALLDLKQNTSALENSAKGMVLPRVNITNLTPVAATGANSLPVSIGSPASESWDLDTHIGLTVYNVYQCPAGKTIVYAETGPQVWDGSRWEILTKPAIVEATPAETSGTNTWGKSVVRHAAKPNPDYVAGTDPGYLKNIYEEFYSADFGPAGRWMTTNLAAWKYDGIMHSQSDGNTANGEDGRTLTGPYINTGPTAATAFNIASWCYPGKDATTGGTSSTDYDTNPFFGLLYTWDAATAGKGGASGTGYTGNEGGSNAYPQIQGICPQGWHLPSDYEWTELENEIIRNTVSYADVAGNIDPGDGTNLLPQSPTTTSAGSENRGTHLPAMLAPCDTVNGGRLSTGKSKALVSNGFNVLQTGFVAPDASLHGNSVFTRYGRETDIWSGSGSANYTLAYYRGFEKTASNSTVYRHHRYKYQCLSVRCVKD